MERGFQLLFCHPGCNSKKSYQTNKLLDPYRPLDQLTHRRSVSALSLFYRYYHGMCSDELILIIPPRPALSVICDSPAPNTPSRLHQRNATSFYNKFIPMTLRDWYSLAASPFLYTSNLHSFKFQVHKLLRFFLFSSIIKGSRPKWTPSLQRALS